MWVQKAENQGVATCESSGSKKETKLARKPFAKEWKLPGSAGLCWQIPFQHQQIEEGRWARPQGAVPAPPTVGAEHVCSVTHSGLLMEATCSGGRRAEDSLKTLPVCFEGTLRAMPGPWQRLW